MPKKSKSKAPAKTKTASKKAKQPREAAPEAEEEPELVLAQSAEVTHESGVLDDAAVVEALGQTEGESLDAFSATTSAPLGAVAGAALGNARCRVLDLRQCPLNDAGDAAFREALSTNTTIVAVRTAVNLDDVAATRASNGLPPLIVTDEDSEDDSEDEEEEGVYCCVEIKILRHVRAESSRRPPRHRCNVCSMAWRCRFLAARPSQDGRVIAEK